MCAQKRLLWEPALAWAPGAQGGCAKASGPPATVHRVLLEECGGECVQHLGPQFHAAVGTLWAAQGIGGGAGEAHLRLLLRHIGVLHERSVAAEAACRRLEATALARGQHSEAPWARVAAEQAVASSPLMCELERAWSQIEALTTELERATRQHQDATAVWNVQLGSERERYTAATIALKDQCLTLTHLLADERKERAGELQRTRQLAARLDATTDELFARGRDVFSAQQRVAEAQQCAEVSVGQMAKRMQMNLSQWRHGHEQQVQDLERRFDTFRNASAGNVSPAEVDRSLLLVAALWHAAGRQAPADLSPEVFSRHVDEVLNAWRMYFNRDIDAELPFLRPSSSIALEPLRVAAGQRAAEVLLHQPPPLDAALLKAPGLSAAVAKPL